MNTNKLYRMASLFLKKSSETSNDGYFYDANEAFEYLSSIDTLDREIFEHKISKLSIKKLNALMTMIADDLPAIEIYKNFGYSSLPYEDYLIATGIIDKTLNKLNS